MLTSRGESTANNSSFSATGRRDHISSTSYSFNQNIPVVRASGPNTQRPLSSTALTTRSASSAPATSGAAPKDAHFPKLPSAVPAAPPSSSLSSSVVRHSTDSVFPSLNSASTSSGSLPTNTKWGKGNRKLVTAAEVVASRPPESNGPTPEEEAAAKARSELATFAKLVPVASAIPRNPGRPTGFSGGLRDTGSVAAMQQQRAASKSKSPTGGKHPPMSAVTKDSISRLRTLSNPKSSGRKAAPSSTPVSNSDVGLSKSLSEQEFRNNGTIQQTSVPTESTEPILAPRSSSGPQLAGSKQVLSSEPSRLNSSRPNRIQLEHAQLSSELSKLNISSPSTKYNRMRSGTDVSSLPKQSESTPNGFHSTSEAHGGSPEEPGPALGAMSAKSLSQSSSDGLSVQDVRRAASSRPGIDRQWSANGGDNVLSSSEEEVREQRRKAFASSPESKSTRPRNSAYQSTRKLHQNIGRRNQSTSSLDTNFARNSQNGTTHRATSFSRGKSTSALEQFRPVESPNYKSNSAAESDDFPRLAIPPPNSRAEALRNAMSASGKNSTVRKASNSNKDSGYSNLSIPRKGLWSGARDAVGERNTRFDGTRQRIGRERITAEEKNEPNVSSATTLFQNSMRTPETYEERLGHLSNFPHRPIAGQYVDRNTMMDYRTPWNQIETDFPSRVPNGTDFIPGNRLALHHGGPASQVLQGYHKESLAMAESARQSQIPGLYAKSPIIGTGGETNSSWMTMTDGAESEAINTLFLRNEARAAELRGGFRTANGSHFKNPIPTVQSIVGQDHTIPTNGSAIEQMRRIQSSARSRLTHAGHGEEYVNMQHAATASNLSGGLLHPTGFPVTNAPGWVGAGPPGFERRDTAQNGNTEFVLPPLPASHEAGFDRQLEMYGYRDDEDICGEDGTEKVPNQRQIW